jgi:hypothetical protein
MKYIVDKKKGEGGVFIAVNNNIVATPKIDLDTNCQLNWVQIQTWKQPPLYIGSYYRQPSSEDLSPLNALDESIAKLTNRQSLPNIILAGDFNLPDINWMDHSIRDRPQYSNTLNQRAIDMSKDNCLHQMTDEPTRNDNILDLVHDHQSGSCQRSSN